MPTSLILIVIGAALVGHVVLCVALVNRLHALGIHRHWVDLLTFLCAVALFAVPAAAAWAFFRSDGDLESALPVWAQLYGGFVAIFCLWALAVRVVRLRDPEAFEVARVDATRVRDLRQEYGDELMAPGTPRALSRLPGNEVLKLQVLEKSLFVPSLPAELEGLKLAHVSDLHMSGRIGIEYFQAVVDAVNSWRPDITAVTGDIVERTECMDWVEGALGQLAAKHGVYFVLGNHDKQVDSERLRQLLSGCGMIDLGRTHQSVKVKGAQIQFGGNELPWFGPPTLPPPTPERGFRVLLAHSPDQFGWACQNHFDLVLAGHNHGGQIRFPVVGAVVCPSLAGTRYACGAFRRGQTVMHVSQGTASLAPLRYNCPPEVSLLTLKRREILAEAPTRGGDLLDARPVVGTASV